MQLEEVATKAEMMPINCYLSHTPEQNELCSIAHGWELVSKIIGKFCVGTCTTSTLDGTN